MKIDRYADFDCRPETLPAMFADRDRFVREHGNLGAARIRVPGHAGDGDRFGIEVPRRGFRRRAGRPVVALDAAPAAVDRGLERAPWDGGSRLRLHFDSEADVPVIGGRIGRFLAEGASDRVEADLDESRRLLAQCAA